MVNSESKRRVCEDLENKIINKLMGKRKGISVKRNNREIKQSLFMLEVQKEGKAYGTLSPI